MKKITKVVDIGTVIQSVFAAAAGVVRVAQSGLDLKPLGALNSAKKVGAGSPVMVFNSGASTDYVTFGAATVSAPSGAADGIPIPSQQSVLLNSGDSEWIISKAATTFGYKADN